MGNVVELQVCITCLNENKEKVGEKFYAEMKKQAEGTQVNVSPVECFSVCDRPVTVTVSQPEKWTYIVGDLKIEKDIPALFEYMNSYARSENGKTPKSERPEVVRNGIIAKVPPK